MINARKETHGAIHVTDPDLCGTGVEIEGPLFVDLCYGVRRRKHLDADFGGVGEDKGSVPKLDSTPGEPGQVNGFNSVGSRERTLCQNAAIREEIFEEVRNASLAIGVKKTWWGSHDDTPVSISLDPIRECGESPICQDFRPAREVEPALRLEIRQLDRDRHAGKIRQKWKNAQYPIFTGPKPFTLKSKYLMTSQGCDYQRGFSNG
jgi:hypothetical protein